MNKTLKRIMTIALALILCLSLATTAFAAEENPNGNGVTKVTVYTNMIVDKGLTQYPATSVQIKVVAGPVENQGDGADAIVGRPAVLDGLKVGTSVGTSSSADVTSQSISFSGTDAKLIGGTDKVTDANHKYASHGVVIDFSGVTFPNPGVYRYTVSQVATAQGGFTFSQQSYQIQVYAIVNDQGQVVPGGTTVTPTDPEDGDDKGKDKNEPTDPTDPELPEPGPGEPNNEYKGGLKGYANFNNYYGDAANITLSKTVTGNQGDRNEEFKFEITINGTAGTYYIIPAEGTSVSGGEGKTGATEIVISAEGTGSGTVYLKDGESVKIIAPEDATYTIKETAAGYKTSVANSGGDDITDPAAANAAGATVDVSGTATKGTTVTYTNDKSNTIPGTGVLLTIAPFVILMIVGVVGVTIMMKKKYN